MKLILLRGLLREQRHWEQVPNLIRSEYPELDVLTPDLAGNGARYQEPSPSSISEMVDDFRSQLGFGSESLPEAGSVILVALSMGGMVASQWCLDYPEEVAGLCLINTSFRCFSSFKQRLNPRWYWPIARFLLSRYSAREKEQFILGLTSNEKRQDQGLLNRFTQYACECPTQKSNVLRQLWAAANYRGEFLPPTRNCLLLSSLGDQLVSPTCSQAIASQWGSELITHPSAGHDLSIDAPEWLVEQLEPLIFRAKKAT